MTRKRTVKAMKAECDRLFSLYIRSHGTCEAGFAQGIGLIDWHPECSPKLETSHCLSRRYSHTRTLELNALCLCSSAHRYITADPGAHARLVSVLRGDQHWQRLRAIANRTDKFDWEAEVQRLRQLTEGLKGTE